MEFLRFGSSIPGSYWGCCACCIIQKFDVDPDAPYSIEVVSGDGGEPIYDGDSDPLFLGKTYREVFETRLRIGTFSEDEMPNHAFFAILTDYQLSSEYGSKWLKLLKENGFEFIRTVDNSVYTGSTLAGDDHDPEKWREESHPNHIFGLFRNIGSGAIDDPFRPPQAWPDLSSEEEEFEIHGYIGKPDTEIMNRVRDALHLKKWREGKTKFYTRKELEAEGIPIWLAGRRSQNPQEMAKYREQRNQSKPGLGSPAPF